MPNGCMPLSGSISRNIFAFWLATPLASPLTSPLAIGVVSLGGVRVSCSHWPRCDGLLFLSSDRPRTLGCKAYDKSGGFCRRCLSAAHMPACLLARLPARLLARVLGGSAYLSGFPACLLPRLLARKQRATTSKIGSNLLAKCGKHTRPNDA